MVSCFFHNPIYKVFKFHFHIITFCCCSIFLFGQFPLPFLLSSMWLYHWETREAPPHTPHLTFSSVLSKSCIEACHQQTLKEGEWLVTEHDANLQLWRADWIHCTVPFCHFVLRDMSSHRFWYPQGLLEWIPIDTEGWLKSWDRRASSDVCILCSYSPTIYFVNWYLNHAAEGLLLLN